MLRVIQNIDLLHINSGLVIKLIECEYIIYYLESNLKKST